jgi:butyrate kinase
MADNKFKILAINPGSTSTKIGYFENEKPVFTESVPHPGEELKKFQKILDQKDFRLGNIQSVLDRHKIDIKNLSAVVGRGGLLRPLESGTYEISEKMLSDLAEAKRGEHASNLGGAIADLLAKKAGVKAYIVDPVSVDELEPIARISGTPDIERESLTHALNTKAVCQRYSKETKKPYSSLNLIVAHLGSGISVTAHKNGRMIDVVNPKEEGPFAMDRCGGIPAVSLVKLCFSGKYGEKELKKRLFGDGGFYAYLGTKDLKEVKNTISGGNEKAKLLFDAMIYQTAKEIGSMATVLKGKVDAVLLTGGMANDRELAQKLEERVKFIAPVKVYPGEDELQALVEGTLRVLRKEEKAKIY